MSPSPASQLGIQRLGDQGCQNVRHENIDIDDEVEDCTWI